MPSPLLPGDPAALGPWRLLGRLGQGGMGVVYQGVRDQAGSTEHAAVKAIWEHQRDDPRALGRFRREIAAVMELDDPGVARVLAADLASHPVWFATELVPGPTLHAEVARTGPIERRTWLSLAVLLLSTLDRIHAHGIVHRDLKPQNVLLGPAGPVIIDFGIATVSGATGMTLTGASPRTEMWAAPEQLSDGPTTPATDVFTLGSVLAWAATGRHPFTGDPAAPSVAVLHAVLTAEPDLAGIDPRDRAWLSAMLRKPPTDRPDTAELIETICEVTVDEAHALADEAYRRRWLGAARIWWQQAADLADPGAMLELGDLADEQGDPDAAHSWWALAAAAGEPAAAVRLQMAGSRSARSSGAPHDAKVRATPLDAEPDPTRALRGHPGPEDDDGPTGRPPGLRARSVMAGIVAALALVVVAGLGWAMVRAGDGEPSEGRIETRPVPATLAGIGAAARVDRISMGDAASCLTTEDGRAHCWGSNADGQLGSSGGDADAPRPVDTSGVLADVSLSRISVGARHACALDSQGSAYCWGANDRGQLGIGEGLTRSDVPVAVDTTGVLAGKRLVLIGSAGATTCALDDVGTLYCWGANDRGQMGNGTVADTARPISVDTSGALRGRALRRFSIGGEHACAVDDQGFAYCWGANEHGQLGIGTTEDSRVPVPVPDIRSIPQGAYESISTGGTSTCGWGRDGAVACWGANGSGQLGTGSTTDSTVPVAVAFDPPLRGPGPFRVNVGAATTCLTSPGDTTQCWGANDAGQVGDGTTRDAGRPVPLAGPADGGDPPQLVRVGSGIRTSCGVSADARLWCWGSDELGMLGDGPG